MAESFAQLLKRHRIATGLSQEMLSECAGISVEAISALERDVRHAPHKATLDLLISALGLDDESRHQIEEAAKVARTRGPQARNIYDDSQDEFRLSNLAAQLTSFVDRESVLAEIKELLQSKRLVTVVGAGGAGKTRCAIRIGAEMLDCFSDGTWLADFARISDPMLLSSVIARSLGVHEVPNRPLLDTLLTHLKRKRLLLILDNCEHVIAEARRVAVALLYGCPNVRILATSRESLSIAGEQAYRMPSLPVPPTSALLSEGEMSQYGAVQLFNDRALSADNCFALTVENTPHVADICRRLDGIPLAIELAAARVKILSPRELAQKLDERFRVLTVGDRSALPRHQTMRALIDWSYDLLPDDERALFRKLSIFAGGFRLETAAAVCSQGKISEIVVLDLLSSLVDKSLVQAEVVEGDTRCRLLESTRQYAREKLRDAGEEETTANAHARAFLKLAEQLDDAYETASDRVWLPRAEPELENFRAALSWSFGARGDVLLGQRLAGMLRRVYYFFGPAEGRQWVHAAQQRVTMDTPAAAVAALDLAEAQFESDASQYKASLRAAERALLRYRELADPRGITEAKRRIGHAEILLGEIAEGEALLGQALEALRALRARRSVSSALGSLAFARLFAGDLREARQRYSQALTGARAIGAERFAAAIVVSLAEVEFRAGDAVAAVRFAGEALRAPRRFGDILHVATAARNMAAYLVALHRYDEARSVARGAVTAACDAQISVGLTFTLQHLAAIAALRPSGDAPVIEDRRRAARILGYVNASLSALEALRQYTEQQEYDAMLSALREALGADDLSKLMAEGRTWTEDQAVGEAMLI